jgi:hypothetical protein
LAQVSLPFTCRPVREQTVFQHDDCLAVEPVLVGAAVEIKGTFRIPHS